MSNQNRTYEPLTFENAALILVEPLCHGWNSKFT